MLQKKKILYCKRRGGGGAEKDRKNKQEIERVGIKRKENKE